VFLRVLGSSSAGNATLFWDDRTSVMVDCGFPPRYIRSSLESLDLDIPSLGGLLLTHAHGDHVNDQSIDLLLKNGIPVFVRRELAASLKRLYPSIVRAARRGLLRTFDGEGTEVGTFSVEAFPVPHDAPGGCFGFKLQSDNGAGRRKATIATDLGYQEESLAEQFADSHACVIESNHDPVMLENSGRPQWLIRRIKEIGHLSNDQCAGIVCDIVRVSSAPPATFILAHISQQCNTNAIALATTREALSRAGSPPVRVLSSFKALPSETVTV
jgi:phosphoribosyl 1,2-cyclic phosphodiesterase